MLKLYFDVKHPIARRYTDVNSDVAGRRVTTFGHPRD